MSAPSPAPDRPHRRLQGWMLGIVLILLGLAAVLAFLTRGTTDPLGADAPQDVFSATRASAAVADVVATPRVVGSEENARAREDLAAQLMDLGYEIEESEGSATRVRVDDARAGGSRVTNLAASLPGSDPTGTLVLATHIDTVPGSPGAGDAGAGLAVVMETARILAAEDPRNDVLVLIVDGEEEGLRGADAYLRDRAGELLSPVVVLNHEARGVSGRPVIIRTAGPVDTVLTGRPGVEAESFNDALFEIVPNDTDFTRYAEADWWGLDMALIGGAWYYHTPWDDARHLDPSSLQTFGDMTLEHARDLSGRDLGALGDPASTRPVLTTQPWGVLTLPVPAVQVIAVLAVALPLVVLAIQRARGRMTVTGFLTSGLGGVVAIIGAGVAAIALWDAGVATRAGFTSYAVGEPRNPALFVVADALVGLLTVTLVWAALRRILTAVTASHGFVFGAAVLFGAAVAWSPGLLSFMVVPVAAGVFGACLVPFLPESARIPVHGVLLLPVAW
ncbi:MAG: M28 family peptidase, partial [Brachybacterium sp.]|nr:M28 family peptidase [Brachybacterium sp.]